MHKIVTKKGTNPSIYSYGETSLHAKTYPRISKSKKGHKYEQKQIRVMGLVPIIYDNHREQVCEVSIHSYQ
jgi:hypothetical protein